MGILAYLEGLNRGDHGGVESEFNIDENARSYIVELGENIRGWADL
jgi:hypothetical protein